MDDQTDYLNVAKESLEEAKKRAAHSSLSEPCGLVAVGAALIALVERWDQAPIGVVIENVLIDWPTRR